MTSQDLVEHIYSSCEVWRHTVPKVSTDFGFVNRRHTLNSRKGMGMNDIARKPSNELAQPTPRFLYMACNQISHAI